MRSLLYDFKNWKSIEATGRGGSDEGFDVRAWEETSDVSNMSEDEEEVGTHPMEGNQWKIQCKREKQLGPTRIKEIIDEGVKANDPPYGYILVAPTTFSKKSYDMFRSELHAKGVMEFHLWGRAELEDFLFLPKNDSILFAFFGFSLITRKRRRTSEIKFALNNKNKLLRILADGNPTSHAIHQPVLVRDFKDVHYPWKDEYRDFSKLPRWKEFSAKDFHPLGLVMNVRRHLAYVNTTTKEYDFVRNVDVLNRRSESLDRDTAEEEQKVRRFCRYLRQANQAEFILRGIIFFEDMLIIDDKGDAYYPFPHIFVDFKAETGPFRMLFATLWINNQEIELDDPYKRISFFPASLELPKPGKKHKRLLELDGQTTGEVGRYSVHSLFDDSGKYDFLEQRDFIQVVGAGGHDGERLFIEITQKYETSAEEYLKDHRESDSRPQIERQIGRELSESDNLTVLEFRLVSEWDIEGN